MPRKVDNKLKNFKNKLDDYFKKDVLYLLKSAVFMAALIYMITKILTYVFVFVIIPAIIFATVVSISYMLVSFISIYLIHLSNKKSLDKITPYNRKITCKKKVNKKYYIEWVHKDVEWSTGESKVSRYVYNDLDVNDDILIFSEGKKLFIFKND